MDGREGLNQTPCDWWPETGSKSSIGGFLIHMDAQDAQDFFWAAGLQS